MFDNIMIMVGGAYQTWSVMPYIQQMSSKFARELHFVGLCQESEQINNSELKDLLDKLVDVIEQKEVLIKKEIIYGNSAEEIPDISSQIISIWLLHPQGLQQDHSVSYRNYD